MIRAILSKDPLEADVSRARRLLHQLDYKSVRTTVRLLQHVGRKREVADPPDVRLAGSSQNQEAGDGACEDQGAQHDPSFGPRYAHLFHIGPRRQYQM